MQIIVSHFTKNTKTSILYHMKNNLRLTLTLILNVRVEDNIIQVQSQVILQDKAEIYEDVFYKKESR